MRVLLDEHLNHRIALLFPPGIEAVPVPLVDRIVEALQHLRRGEIVPVGTEQ